MDDLKKLARKIANLRHAQKEYARTGSKTAYITMIKHEKIIDMACEQIFNEKKLF